MQTPWQGQGSGMQGGVYAMQGGHFMQTPCIRHRAHGDHLRGKVAQHLHGRVEQNGPGFARLEHPTAGEDGHCQLEATSSVNCRTSSLPCMAHTRRTTYAPKFRTCRHMLHISQYPTMHPHACTCSPASPCTPLHPHAPRYTRSHAPPWPP